MNKILPLIFRDNILYILDQRQLPHEITYKSCQNVYDVHDSIRDMVVRGAPCIGFCALYGLVLWAQNQEQFDTLAFKEAIECIAKARPTAVNLEFELKKANKCIEKLTCIKEVYKTLKQLADKELELSEIRNTKMSDFVVDELVLKFGKKKLNILTHCNTGYLACGSLGTALGVIERLKGRDLVEHVYVDETRPYLQGSRLTSFELKTLSIDHSIVVEGAASFLMGNNKVDAIVVGADRIAINGDTANKIGTANLAIIAKHFEIPFYVIAPLSSFDRKSKTGSDIEVEMRSEDEIHYIKKERISPMSTRAFNPSFDISAGALITAISCENSLLKPPYTASIAEVLK